MVFSRPKWEEGEGLAVVDKDIKKVGEKVREGLSPNQKSILELIAKDPMISAQQLAQIVGISSRKIEVNIAKLKRRGRLKRIGPDKGGHWEVVTLG